MTNSDERYIFILVVQQGISSLLLKNRIEGSQHLVSRVANLSIELVIGIPSEVSK